MKNPKKLTLEEAEKFQKEMEKMLPGRKFIFRPDTIQLPPLEIELESIFETAVKRIRDGISQGMDVKEIFIVYPVEEPQNTKKNKFRLTKDRASPLGMIVKDDVYALQKYKPYAPAMFKAQEIVVWASDKLTEEAMKKETAEVAQ